MSNTIGQIQALLSSLPAEQRAKVMGELNLKSFNVMTLSEQDAKALLLRLQTKVATMSNPIKESHNEYLEGQRAKKSQANEDWNKARKEYYSFKSKLYGDNDTVENRQHAQVLFENMMGLGYKAVDITTFVNNLETQAICMQNRDIGWG